MVLTRRHGESLIIELPNGEQITITALALKGNQVRIGTQAAENLAILPEELLAADTDA